jgi:hypothetical protein
MICGHQVQHPFNGLPFVCTRDKHGNDTGHIFEWKHAGAFGAAVGVAFQECGRQMEIAAARLAQFAATARERR